jgi:hypothetical protein
VEEEVVAEVGEWRWRRRRWPEWERGGRGWGRRGREWEE